MTPIKVFFLEPTDRERRWLRRFNHGAARCATGGSYCNAMFEIGEFDIRYKSNGYVDATYRSETPPRDDPRWPAQCEACGKPFGAGDGYQIFSRQIYCRLDTGARCTLDNVEGEVPMADTTERLRAELDEAEKKAWDALGRYKFQMFGYWAAIWVHLNRIGGFKRPNPWKNLVRTAAARQVRAGAPCR